MPDKGMHPLCCISIDCPGIGGGDRSPGPPPEDFPDSDPEAACGGGAVDSGGVAGVLYKWTNYGSGWRSRWFCLRGGILYYSKIRRRSDPFPPREASSSSPVSAAAGLGFRLIGNSSVQFTRAAGKPVGVVCLKISSFRESRSDDRKFYIFSPTKTLHLRTDSKICRTAWIEAFISARSTMRLNEKLLFQNNSVPFSTERLRDRMLLEGLDEALIKDCEEIVLSEHSEYKTQLKLQYEERFSLLDSYGPKLEGITVQDESAVLNADGLQLIKRDFSSSGHGKYSEYSTTESSDDVEKQELEELSEEEEICFYDSKEFFSECPVSSTKKGTDFPHESCRTEKQNIGMTIMDFETENCDNDNFLQRRKKLPEPIEKEKSVSLWSVIKDNVGKDLTRVCLPVYFNEPLSSLQKCFEDLEYSHLLDRAYEYGKSGNSLLRILNVAAFAVSGYASLDGRPCKPFNPLLGETYEAEYPEKGIRFFSEKVSHHPMLIACHCEGNGWKIWGDSTLRSKFWGRSIQVDPVGILTLEFDDGEIFQWSKVTTTIYNLIMGKVYCDHHGIMNIQGNRQYSCKLKFKEQSLLDRNSRQVHGYVEDAIGSKVASIRGKWDGSMYYTLGDDMCRTKGSLPATLLWKRSKPPADPTRYNLSSFAITLNELTSELKEKLPPTDSRLRPDQRHLENGEYESANAEKQRLEKRQRLSKKKQDDGWKPRWFERDSESGTYRYIGGYWEARDLRKWDGCPNIFNDISEDLIAMAAT